MSVEVWVTLGGVILAGLLAWHQLRASLYVRRREFEDIYVQRYWEISNRLNLDLRIGSYSGGDFAELADAEDKDAQYLAMWDYLALCEDQIDLRKSGNVTDEAWAVWSSSIAGTVSRYPYEAFYDLIEQGLDEAHVDESDRPWEHLRTLRHDPGAGLPDPYPLSGTGWRQRWRRYATGRRERVALTGLEVERLKMRRR
ncbi:hypothetical protein FE251_09520 [Georgenia wutianyii]|uniref:DUF4760 domain-containing protein n=1 Tax=Georgenia wutianyii TaxID=2585135 RepID=A0ABX5VSB4_9MICO|nr:hypothetical protein [Georgenia wutianyii]QDB79585.1 hypothetical protein FE251_09520 [Georgenia wutianyii]